MSNEAFVILGLVGFVSSAYVGLVRNTAVCGVRMSFIGEPAYDLLPSYNTMMYSPRYQLLWTKAQWMAWVEKQGGEA